MSHTATARPQINEITEAVIGAAIKVHKALGPGLLESAYEACLTYELQKRGLNLERQKSIPVTYEDVKIDCGFRVDLIVEGLVVVEIKAKRELHPIDEAQIISYLRLLDLSVGLIVNFHELRLVDGVKRVVNKYRES